MDPPGRLSVLILAGGRSARMGRDKAWLDCGGIPLIEHVARRLLPLASEIIISTNEPASFAELLARVPAPGRVVVDRFPEAGPLAGLHAGLAGATGDLVLAVATDMPFVDLRLVLHMASLAQGVDAVVPLIPVPGEPDPLPEPLHAIYRPSCLSAVAARLEQGHRRMVSFLPDVSVRYLAPAEIAAIDPGFDSFLNINTPDEWPAARARLARRARP